MPKAKNDDLGIKELTVTVFETTDGIRHDHILDAELHQCSLNFAKSLTSDFDISPEAANEIATWIRTNKSDVASYIQHCDRIEAHAHTRAAA